MDNWWKIVKISCNNYWIEFNNRKEKVKNKSKGIKIKLKDYKNNWLKAN